MTAVATQLAKPAQPIKFADFKKHFNFPEDKLYVTFEKFGGGAKIIQGYTDVNGNSAVAEDVKDDNGRPIKRPAYWEGEQVLLKVPVAQKKRILFLYNHPECQFGATHTRRPSFRYVDEERVKAANTSFRALKAEVYVLCANLDADGLIAKAAIRLGCNPNAAAREGADWVGRMVDEAAATGQYNQPEGVSKLEALKGLLESTSTEKGETDAFYEECMMREMFTIKGSKGIFYGDLFLGKNKMEAIDLLGKDKDARAGIQERLDELSKGD